MAHKITISNGQVSGLTQDEAQTLLNFTVKNQNVQKVIGQVAEKVQESIAQDVTSLKRFVEQGKVSQEDAYLLMEDYFTLSDSLRTIREATIAMDMARVQEGIVDNVKDFGKTAYAKAGVAFNNATQAAGKAIRNIVNWIKRHPKLAIGLTVVALMVLLPAAAHASTPVRFNSEINGILTQHTFYVTSGQELNEIAMFLGQNISAEDQDLVLKCLRVIGNNSVLVLPDGTYLTGTARELVTHIIEGNMDGAVLLSQYNIPGTSHNLAHMTKAAVHGLATDAFRVPGL